ncbi:transcription initiation factor IID, 31kD subunit-domain-containing protein [Chytriomyces cf. hyalinus JEL632]|nr:transcription initiation factor IID, 31kD subunit-domain-containing protein [Chytriomyces cf. hyalinus JEL632]
MGGRRYDQEEIRATDHVALAVLLATTLASHGHTVAALGTDCRTVDTARLDTVTGGATEFTVAARHCGFRGGIFMDLLLESQQQQQQHQEPLELPRNARIVSLIMQAMDVTDYQPAVLPKLMELVHRYVLDVVADAQLFADHAGRTEIDADDVRLAVEAKMSHSFTGAPSKEVFDEFALELELTHLKHANSVQSLSTVEKRVPLPFGSQYSIGRP